MQTLTETQTKPQTLEPLGTLEPLADIIARIFNSPAPCTGCGRNVPTFHDRQTGNAYCLDCLETAVTEAQAELIAERQDAARLGACYGVLYF